MTNEVECTDVPSPSEPEAQQSLALPAPASLPPDIRAIFGPPPPMPDGDVGAYTKLYLHVWDALKPTDFIEECWVQDFSHHVFEIIQLRRLRAELFRAFQGTGVNSLLRPMLSDGQFAKAVRGYARGEEQWRKYAHDMLSRAGHDETTIAALVLTRKFEDFERIDKMILTEERRRDEVLREVERRRAHLAEQMRRVGQEVVDADYEDVAEPEPQAAEGDGAEAPIDDEGTAPDEQEITT